MVLAAAGQQGDEEAASRCSGAVADEPGTGGMVEVQQDLVGAVGCRLDGIGLLGAVGLPERRGVFRYRFRYFHRWLRKGIGAFKVGAADGGKGGCQCRFGGSCSGRGGGDAAATALELRQRDGGGEADDQCGADGGSAGKGDVSRPAA